MVTRQCKEANVRVSLRAVSVAASFSTRMRLYVPKHQVAKVFFMGDIECEWAIREIVNAARIPPRPGYRPATDDQRQRGTGHKATEAEGPRDNSMVLGKSKRDRNCIKQ